MVKRTDVDYFAKGTAAPNSIGGTMNGNDQIAFYSTVPGYYPSTGAQSPVSLVAYRINLLSGASLFNKSERLGKGLVWNAVSTTDTPVVFLPRTISATWPYATNATKDPSSPSAYETIGPQAFRFEYYYLLKGVSTTNNAIFTVTPWDARISGHTSVSGMQDVAAIVVAIAVIDPRSKELLMDSDLTALGSSLIDFGGDPAPFCPSPQWQLPGQLLAQWQCVLDASSLPRPAISGIRLYERYFYLSQ